VAFGEFDNTLDDEPEPGVALSTATCDAGDTVLSGSYSINNPDLAEEISDRSLDSNTGWTTEATSTAPDLNVLIRTFAQCFDNPPPIET
jgi:hypothetical protein